MKRMILGMVLLVLTGCGDGSSTGGTSAPVYKELPAFAGGWEEQSYSGKYGFLSVAGTLIHISPYGITPPFTGIYGHYNSEGSKLTFHMDNIGMPMDAGMSAYDDAVIATFSQDGKTMVWTATIGSKYPNLLPKTFIRTVDPK